MDSTSTKTASSIQDVGAKDTKDTSDNSKTEVPKQNVDNTKAESIRLVLQRFRHAALLLDGKEVVHVGEQDVQPNHFSEPTNARGCGIAVYISFAKSTTRDKVLQAAKTVLNLPLLTEGGWGDGSSPCSILDMATTDTTPYLVLIPQANLISKVRSQGKSLQYHGQIDKEVGREFYHLFCDYCKALLIEHQCKQNGETTNNVPKWVSDLIASPTNQKAALDPSIPPKEMFKDKMLYSEWDQDGIPTRDCTGQELTKSAMKKLRKQQANHQKRHEKYLNTSPKPSSATANNTTKKNEHDWEMLDASFCQVVAGSFGTRQAMQLTSDMGPFCHVVNL